jgi:DNA-binding beta-propeller fold protein YncE
MGGFGGGSTDTRGMQFSPTGERLYLVNRQPPLLEIIDTSLSKTGFPVNKGVAGAPICREASTLTVLDPGDGERVYLTCFQDGQIYVVNPEGQSRVEDIIEVGRGPYAIAASKTRDKLYVTNFLEDTIAVIDVSPTSPLRDRVVMRIGEVRQP